MQGWIKLDRNILESKIFANPNDLKIWIWLMCKASTVDRFVSLKIGKGSTTVELKRGQMIFGRHKAEQDLKIDGSTIYRTLQRFADEQAIKIKANNQFSIVTVNDFIESQTFAEVENFEIEEIEQPMNNQSEQVRTTNEQPTNKQRATNEQPTNTVLEGLESKEGFEGSESPEGKKASPVNGHINGNLFGSDPLKTNSGKKEKRTGAQKEKREIVFPWNSCEFLQAWENWKQYKAGEFKFQYKTPQSEQAALLNLSEISNGSEADAIKIINNTMAKGWKGLFALKNDENGTVKQINNAASAGSSKDRGANELLAALAEDRRAYYNGKNDAGPKI